ncbi:MAG: Glu/Leu/Phe/Val dehydrogenase dimerization domain-containing protein [Candidatus Promineifilaceae bacterium]|jgi:glutamate dehydrogenase/leucine dehydrogenase/CBS domain-containing protein
MIPRYMNQFLREALPERTWQNRLRREGPLAFMEFGPLDVDRLKRLGIEVDSLGPRLVVCLWDEESPLELGGYLVVDNLAMGRPSMGGIRMLPDVTPAAIHNLARGMTLKNAAANLPYGGGKSGIVAPRKLDPADRETIIRGWARLIRRYQDIYLPGPDVGTNDEDMKTIAIVNGLEGALSKTADMGGNRIDQLGGAAQSVVVAVRTVLEEIERMKVLPQFADLELPSGRDLTVLIQGFGAVGTHVARLLDDVEESERPRIVGISDISGYIYDEGGLPVAELLQMQADQGVMALPYFQEKFNKDGRMSVKYATHSDDLLRESAFCLVPAAPIANYLDVDAASGCSMTVDRMGDWSLIVEGANTYSPDPRRKAARSRMERSVYWQKGVLIATDFLVNSGGVILAAQEHLIKAPAHLQIPQEMLGDRAAVDGWLDAHSEEFAALAEERRLAGEQQIREVVRRNMQELIELLVNDPDMLPCEAAEEIAIGRIASSESDRTAADIMKPIPTILASHTVREAAQILVESTGDLLAVVSADGELCGVMTDWDITRATATGCGVEVPVSEIMSREVISAAPENSILDVLRKLEHYEISAVPVVNGGGVMGVISSDTLAQGTLYRLLQAQG